MMEDVRKELVSKKSGGVARELEVVNKQLEELTTSIGTLESLIDPILKRGCREECSAETAEVTSDMAGMIRSISDRLGKSTEIVKALQDRVDL